MVFSPFGLGVLDLAVGKYVYDRLAASAELGVVDGFFHELRRHGEVLVPVITAPHEFNQNDLYVDLGRSSGARCSSSARASISRARSS